MASAPLSSPESVVLPAAASTSDLQIEGNGSLASIDSKITIVNTNAVVISSAVLPTGASTSDLQSAGNESLTSIDGKITTVNTNAVTVSSSALPTGAATAALQSTGNESLASIDGKMSTGVLVNPNDAYLDAFSRTRISAPSIIFDSKFLSSTSSAYLWNTATTGTSTSTYNTNQASYSLTVGATNSSAIRQTARKFNYQPGRGLTVILTGVLGTQANGVFSRIGYFDADNGLFFMSNNGTISVNVRTFTSGSAVTTSIGQSAWNLDKLDGTGRSGITLDITKTQIFLIDFQWLGVGRIRYGFGINGLIYWCHQITNANVLSVVYMSNPNLPIRYEIVSTTGTAGTLVQICSCIISEGGDTNISFPRVISTDTTALSITGSVTTWFPILVLRLATGFTHAAVSVTSVSVLCDSNLRYRWQLVINPTYVGTALTYGTRHLTNSAVEYATPTSATTVTENTGLRIGAGYLDMTTGAITVPQLSTINSYLGSSIAGVSDTMALCVAKYAAVAGTETLYATMNFNESF